MPPFPSGDNFEPRLPILPDFDGGNAVKIGVNSAETKPQVIHLFFVCDISPTANTTDIGIHDAASGINIFNIQDLRGD